MIINISGDYAGKPMQDSGVYALMERLQKKTGIKVTPHMLRHYFANARRKAGWKLELISQALGHRNIETTMRYLNISDQELIDVSDEFYRKHQSIYEMPKRIEQANMEYFNQTENLLATGIIPKKRGEKTGK